MKRGQVWVETVIYTLVALVLIGLVLTFVRPKITEIQDKVVIQQSISTLNTINNVITSLSEGGVGNKRKLEVTIKSGSLTVDGVNNKIIFNVEGHYQFSENNKTVNYSGIEVYDKIFNNLNIINLTLNYDSKYNITYNGGDTSETFTQSSTPYNIFISNNGNPGGGKTNMDFSKE